LPHLSGQQNSSGLGFKDRLQERAGPGNDGRGARSASVVSGVILVQTAQVIDGSPASAGHALPPALQIERRSVIGKRQAGAGHVRSTERRRSGPRPNEDRARTVARKK